jgi:triosephosphate isomerase
MLKFPRYVIGNWKMQGSLAQNTALIQAIFQEEPTLSNCHVVICPPLVYLDSVQHLLVRNLISLGAQDVSAHSAGAYTGQVSANMLKEIGCQYVIVGHSERRQYQAESNTEVAEKSRQAISAGLIPIVCVSDEFEAQLAPVLHAGFKGVIAYEPIWAIGTGISATPSQAEKAHAAIRQCLEKQGIKAPIVYGGSVKASNAEELCKMPNIDGFLVGGASLQAPEFLDIIRKVQS